MSSVSSAESLAAPDAEVSERRLILRRQQLQDILAGRGGRFCMPVWPQLGRGWSLETPVKMGTIRSAHPRKGRFGVFIIRQDRPDFCETDLIPSPFGGPGDRLWLAEPFRLSQTCCGKHPTVEYGLSKIALVGSPEMPVRDVQAGRFPAPFSPLVVNRTNAAWNMPGSMPRWAARLMLEITEITVLPVQSVTAVDAWLNGISMDEVIATGLADESPDQAPIEAFRRRFVRDHGIEAWEGNWLVWQVSHRPIEP